MIIPSQFAWICGAMLGWGAMWLTSQQLQRRRRTLLHTLASALKSDASYDAKDHALIQETLDQARGDALVLVLPVFIPIVLLILALVGVIRNRRSAAGMSPVELLEQARFRESELAALDDTINGRGTVRSDPRFRRLGELAFEVEAFRWPFTSLLTLTISVPALLLYLIAYGKREAVMIIPQLGFRFRHCFPLLRKSNLNRPGLL